MSLQGGPEALHGNFRRILLLLGSGVSPGREGTTVGGDYRDAAIQGLEMFQHLPSIESA